MVAVFLIATTFYGLSLIVGWFYAVPRLCKALEDRWPEGDE